MTLHPIPPATLSDDEILAVMAPIIAQSLRIDRARVTRGTTLPALGAESIDIIEITLDLEHAFSVLMPEHSVLQLAREVGGEGVFDVDDVLTESGSRLLQARMPYVESSMLAPGTPVGELPSVFLRIDVWIQLVHGLLASTPRNCPHCGERLVQGSPARVKCRSCNIEVELPTGDDIGREWVRQWLAAQPS
jgi:acyl carrier protein